MGRTTVALFAKRYQATAWWDITGLWLAVIRRMCGRGRLTVLADHELAQRFHQLLENENEDVEEVFREFLVPSGEEEQGGGLRMD